MLEIILIWVCAKNIGKIVTAKGHKAIGYQVMLVAFWIGGELIGAFAGAFIQAGAGGQESGVPCLAYICALVGAAVGAGIAFVIANSLTPIQHDDEFYRGDEYGRGRREWDDRQPRGLGEPDDRRPPAGDQITDRPPERPQDDRIQE